MGDDHWPEDSIPASAVPACPVCSSLVAWESWTHVWHCLRCDPPIHAVRFWSYEKRQASAAVVERVRRDAKFAAEHERLMLFGEEAV